MSESYSAYLELLDALAKNLQSLSQLAGEKAAAVRNNDLTALDAVMRREQALSLSFRGLEQKKDALVRTLGLEAVPLSGLADRFPPDLRMRAKQTVEALQDQYAIYRAAAEVARNTLECNLHEIEAFLQEQDAASVAGPGYAPPAAEVPPALRSDFRA